LLQVGIVGIGVLGKTTISQKIFNSKQLVDRFVKRVWVSLSQIVSEEEIMKTMSVCQWSGYGSNAAKD